MVDEPDITLPAPLTVPPIVLLLVPILTALPEFPIAAVPAAFIPI